MSGDNDLPWMPWYPADFDASTSMMSFDERWVYAALLFKQWQLGELPADVQKLAVSIHLRQKRFDAAWKVVSHKFERVQLEGGALVLRQKRVQKDRLERLDLRKRRVESARVAGRASAASRQRDVDPTLTQGQPNVQRDVNPPKSDLRKESESLPNPSLEPGRGPEKSGLRKDGSNPRAKGTNRRARNQRKLAAIIVTLNGNAKDHGPEDATAQAKPHDDDDLPF
jgi:uncharacterized protein YdaU (DUF1376 family)